jgi:hypothetical protein
MKVGEIIFKLLNQAFEKGCDFLDSRLQGVGFFLGEAFGGVELRLTGLLDLFDMILNRLDGFGDRFDMRFGYFLAALQFLRQPVFFLLEGFGFGVDLFDHVMGFAFHIDDFGSESIGVGLDFVNF